MKKNIFIYLLMLFVFTALIRRDLRVNLSYDESVYAYIGGEIITNGKIPYKDAFDQKPILIYLPFTVTEMLVGHGWFYIRLIGMFMTFLTLFLMFLSVKSIFGLKAATLCVLLETLVGNLSNFDGQFNLLTERQLKLYLIMFLSYISNRNIVKKKIGILGLLASFSFLVKQTYGLLIIEKLINLWKSFNISKMYTLSLYLFGFFVLPIIIVGVYLVINSLPELYYSQVGYLWENYINIRKPSIANSLTDIFTKLKVILPVLFVSILSVVNYKYFNNRQKIFVRNLLLTMGIGIFSIWSGLKYMHLHYLLMVIYPGLILASIGINSIKNIPKLQTILTAVIFLYIAIIGGFDLTKNYDQTNYYSKLDSKLIKNLYDKSSQRSVYMVGNAIYYYYEHRMKLFGNYISAYNRKLTYDWGQVDYLVVSENYSLPLPTTLEKSCMPYQSGDHIKVFECSGIINYENI